MEPGVGVGRAGGGEWWELLDAQIEEEEERERDRAALIEERVGQVLRDRQIYELRKASFVVGTGGRTSSSRVGRDGRVRRRFSAAGASWEKARRLVCALGGLIDLRGGLCEWYSEWRRSKERGRRMEAALGVVKPRRVDARRIVRGWADTVRKVRKKAKNAKKKERRVKRRAVQMVLQVVVVKQRDLDRSRLREMIANWYECAVADNVEARKYEQALEMARRSFADRIEDISHCARNEREAEAKREGNCLGEGG